MVYGLYLRKGIVYLPTFAKVDAGGYMEIDPMATVPVSHTSELRNALHEAIARGNPIIPSPTRASYPEPAILKHAGVKSFAAFARGALPWMIQDKDGTHQIIGQRIARTGGWEDDPDQIVTLPPGSSVDDVIERMIEVLQAAASQ